VIVLFVNVNIFYSDYSDYSVDFDDYLVDYFDDISIT
jgi:hypothetical protein